ncbi:FAD-dependent oxidoreductase [Piscinibacter sp. XHJ-5]|uniref:NAD(P)/FAD-dependent oxidoreductase n=1 Tax=Piscinibacter sp. XHJ-5 TaxID=3037797 RepID=UPI002452ED1F|nr:FAD-dependent oxidoreductase [Piscinibacter sp. XHJ-5]
MREFDVAIVGAGIAGASLAHRLAGRRSVVLLEREPQPGYHATGRSAAMFMETYGPPAVRALTRASRAFYEHPPGGFAEQPLLGERGVLYLAERGQEALLADMRTRLLAGCPDLQTLDADGALAHVGCLRPEVVHGALFERAAQDIDVHALHQGFLRGMRAQGGELRTNAAVEAAVRVGPEWELRCSGGETLRAATVVNAAGAWADEVAGRFGAQPIGLVPHRRSAFTFKAPQGIDVSRWPAVVGVDEGYYFKPDAGQLLGSPANADPTFAHDVVPEELDIAIGIDRIEAVTTLRIRRPASTWAGLRSFVRDGEMVIGFDDAAPGFFWLAGQGGYGIQSAAGAAELAASQLCGEGLPPSLARHGVDPHALSPRRLR